MDAPTDAKPKLVPLSDVKTPSDMKAPPTFLCYEGRRSRHRKCLADWAIPAYETSTEQVRVQMQKVYRDAYEPMQEREKNDPLGRKWFHIAWNESLYFDTCCVWAHSYIFIHPDTSDDDIERLLDDHAFGEGDASIFARCV